MTPKTTRRIRSEELVQAHLAQPSSRRTSSGCAPCVNGIVANGRVMTLSGPRAVQSLRAGDKIITRGQGAVPLVRVEQQSVVTRATYIFAGTLGHYQTDRDTLLPAGQLIHVRDWRARVFSGHTACIMRAQDLVDGEFVRDLGLMPLTIYRLFFAAPHVIYADGMELLTEDNSTRKTAA